MSTDMCDMEDDVDPRVQIELEKLNSATDEINKLEVDLDEARAAFRLLLMDSTRKIEELAKKLGTCIERARPYYEARLKAKEALQETQQAAVRFERANSAHAAAKEMVFLAEEGLKAEGRTFDHAWQEMLNHATMRVNESELERTLGEAEHRRTSMLYHDAETRVQHMQKDLKRAIAKSRPYFEMKAQSNQLLEQQKTRVRALERQVAQSKLCYAKALGNLEKISDEIHQNRRESQQAAAAADLGTRIAGVGAESSPSHQLTPAHQPSPSTTPVNSTGDTTPQIKTPKTPIQPSQGSWSHSNQDDEFLGLPATLGPAASPLMQPAAMGKDCETPDYLGLSQLSAAAPTSPSCTPRVERMEVVPAKMWTAAPGSSSERVRELLTQGMMMLNITSLAERISSTPPTSTQGTPARRRSSCSSTNSQMSGMYVSSRKVPSPLEKSLLYLTAGDDDSASDSESLASVEMLSDDQVASLMLDRQAEEDLLSETDEDPLLGPACQALNVNHNGKSVPSSSPARTSPSVLSPAPTHPLLTNP